MDRDEVYLDWMEEARQDYNRLVGDREIEFEEAEVLAPQMGFPPSQLMLMNFAVITKMPAERVDNLVRLVTTHSKEEVIRILEEGKKNGADSENESSSSTIQLAPSVSEKAAAEDHRQLGNEAFKRKDYEAAVKHYTSSIEQVEDHRAFSNRAACWIRMGGRQIDAIKDAQRAIELCPTFAKAWYRKIQVFFSLRDFPRARLAAQQGLQHCPNSEELYHVAFRLKALGVPNESADPTPYLEHSEKDGIKLEQCVFCHRRVPAPVGDTCPACNCKFRVSGITPQRLEEYLQAIMRDDSTASFDAHGRQHAHGVENLEGGSLREAAPGAKTVRVTTADSASEDSEAEDLLPLGERRVGMGSEEAFSLLGGMQPFASPLQCINRSGLCAATRMLQLRLFGVHSCSVRSKIEEYAASNPEPFAVYQGAVEQIDQVSTQPRAWEPVLFQWEVVKGASKTNEEMGCLVFVDGSTTRLLVVEVFTCGCLHVQEVSKIKANILFNLLRHLAYRPQMVLYAGLSAPHPTLPPDLLSLLALPTLSITSAALTPTSELWGAITEASFTPALAPSVIDRIDLLIQRDPIMSSQIARQRAELGTSLAELRTQHTLRKAAKPNTRNTADGSAPRQDSMRKYRLCDNCARSCKEAGVEAMRACASCKMAFYCSAECQRRKWKVHKPLCRQPSQE